MYLKCHQRKKDGKVHRYWSVVESYRLSNGRTAKRQVLYLGEINDSQRLAWCKTIEAFEGEKEERRQVALFPSDREQPQLPAQVSALHINLAEMQLHRPRQWGACWLALELWQMMEFDQFFAPKLGRSRKGTDWHKILQVLVAARLIRPSSEWYVHREWYRQTALGDLLDLPDEVVPKNALYDCHDQLLDHKKALFIHLGKRWRDLFGARFEVLLYDLTSTYFESDPPPNFDQKDPDSRKKRRYGYSRDKRPDCLQVVIALVVTPQGYPLAYEVFAGNTQDKQTLRGFLSKIENLYGKAERIWVMDRGIPTEEVLEEMRGSDPLVHYICGTPKGRLNRYEKVFLKKDWECVRQGVEVKRMEESGEVYVMARSSQRVNKERAMRRKRLRRLWQRLHEIREIKEQSRDELLMRIGAAKKDAGRVWSLVEVKLPKENQAINSQSFSFELKRAKLRRAYRREGCYLLRAFVPAEMDAKELWHHYMGLTQIEESFKNLKGDLAIRPIHHQHDQRIEAHIFLSFLAYCLHVALEGKVHPLAPGLTPRAVLEKFATVQMIDVHFPITDGRHLVMPRYTQPDKDLKVLLQRTGIELPKQPPPKIEAPAQP